MEFDFPLPQSKTVLSAQWKEAFHDTDEFIRLFFEKGFDLKRCLLLREGDEILSSLYWFDCYYQNRPVAYLYGISTDPKWRGSGLCHQLMDQTHAYLKKQGYLGCLLVPAGPTLFPFYESMGYLSCCRHKEFLVGAGEKKIAFSPLSAKEYLTLRNDFLPPNSILQKDVSFTENYTQFFRGDSFLFALEERNHKPFLTEYLGAPTVIPDIILSLNAKEAIVRIPGSEKPFAMFHSFEGNEIPLPSYFGFAFD